MAMPAIRRHWTASAVRELQNNAWPRYELIDGELLVTPSAIPAHQGFAFELAMQLNPYTEKQSIGITLLPPADIELRQESIVQPDVFVLPPDDRALIDIKWTDFRSLVLAVEVLSPSTARDDRTRKRDLYMDNNVAEYWIVDLDGRLVERWFPGRENPVVETSAFEWRPAESSEPLTIDLPALFDRVRLPRRI